MQTLLRDGHVVTCDAQDTVIEGGSVLLRGREIVCVGKSADVEREVRRAGGATRVIDARGQAILPGFVQAHVHLVQVIMRGMADDLPLLDWLKNRIWPLEAAHDDATLKASAELGLTEMMTAGTTTILDMGTTHGHDIIMDACVRSGIRAISGKAMMDSGEGVPKRLCESTKSSLSESARLAKAWTGKGDGRIGYGYAPRFILSCTEKLFRGVVEQSAEDGSLLHTHAAEHDGERKAVRAILGKDDIAILREWGVAGPRTILAHGVQLTDAEAKLIAKDGTRIVHCPSANLKLGSGIARVATLQKFGVQMALGADGAPCNNNLDPWTELRHAALLAKSRTGVTTLPAMRALRLATIDGAVALGLGERTGSLEPNKRADITMARIDGAHAEPGGDAVSRLVYACGARDVTHVFVDGKLVAKHGEHQLLDGERVVSRAREQGRKLALRAATV